MHCSVKAINWLLCQWLWLSVFCLCFYPASTVNAQSHVQLKEKKVTISEREQTLGTILNKLSSETDITIFFNPKEPFISDKASIEANDRPFSEVIDQLLTPRGLVWGALDEKTVYVKKMAVATMIPIQATKKDTQRLITGRVITQNRTPVPGTTVIIKNTKKGDTTDKNGFFAIKHVISDSTRLLVISNVAYKQTEVTIGKKNDIGEIILIDNMSCLTETVVKGYYNTTKKFNTGNVNTVKSEEIAKQPVSDPLLALQGRVPGLNIRQTTGVQGGGIDIQLRGRISLNYSAPPLFIVDGVPYEPSINAAVPSNYGALGSVLSALNFLNSSDIESIEILKDADATSIYGSRGANGVIIITTKRGKIDDLKIDVNVNTGFQKLLRKRNLLGTSDYLKMRREAFKNDGEAPTVQNAPDLMYWDTTRYTDWQKEMVGKTARYTDAQVSISGGSPILQCLVGLNYHDETTTFPGDFGSLRAGGHVSLSATMPRNNIKLDFTGGYTYNETKLPGTDFARFIRLSPNAPALYKADGSLNWENSTWQNPHSFLYSKSFKIMTDNLVSNVNISIPISPTLTFKTNIGLNKITNKTFSATLLAGEDPASLSGKTAEAISTTSNISIVTSDPQLSYSRKIGDGKLEATTAITILSRKMGNQHIFNGGYEDDAMVTNPAAAPAQRVVASGNHYKYLAVSIRGGYILKDRYLINLTFRRDGSSRFGPNNQFASFASVAAGWIFTEEHFAKTSIPFISFGKLRLSHGTTGNDQIGDYQYSRQYEFLTGRYQNIIGTRVTGVTNPNFEWERTKKTEIGLEIAFLNNRISADLSRYYWTSGNQLSQQYLSVIAGAPSVLQNLPAIIKNNGWELTTTTRNIISNHFVWTTNITYSANKNKLTSYNGTNMSLKTDRPITTIELYKFSGIDPANGAPLFEDKEGKATELNENSDGARATVDPTPVFQGGINNSITYKNFTFSIFFQFVKQTALSGIFIPESAPGDMNNQPLEILNQWKKEGDKVRVQRFSQNNALSNPYFTTWFKSDAAYSDASFIRCKNIYLSWQLPSDWLKKRNNNTNLNIYATAQNLFTLTKYKGWDPETLSATVIPPVSTFSIGIRSTF